MQITNPFGKHPETDWKIIFFTTFFVALITIAVNVFVYIKIGRGEIFTFTGKEEGSGATLNMEELSATLDYYKKKAETFQRIIKTGSSTPGSDPSL